MDKKKLLELLSEQTTEDSKKILLIDGLNLFFRTFSVINKINTKGFHIGGLGGFFRSLGFLIKNIGPDEVYVVFDGLGSSDNRKNLIPSYKSNRSSSRVVNWDVFDNVEESEESTVYQITRIIDYLKLLPLKVIALDGAEADDVIAYLSKNLTETNKSNKVFIVSADKDFLQLINENITVYRPIEKKFYTNKEVLSNFNIPASNFILYKTLIGDTSDVVKGVKGIGKGKILKFFPELKEKELTLDDIYNISAEKLNDHVVYARIIQEFERVKKEYKIMNLKNPMLSENDIDFLNKFVQSKDLNYYPDKFILLAKEDELDSLIAGNIDFYLREVYEPLKNK